MAKKLNCVCPKPNRSGSDCSGSLRDACTCMCHYTREARYQVEQLGYSDFGVWDNQDDRWVFEGNRNDCEDQVALLNGAEK
jgi:hypothetical protein